MKDENGRRPRIGRTDTNREGARREQTNFGDRPHFGRDNRFSGRNDERLFGNRDWHGEQRDSRPTYGSRPRRFEGNSDRTDDRPRRQYGNYGDDRNRRPQFDRSDSRERSFKPYRRNENFDENAKYSQKKQAAYKKYAIDYHAPMRLNRFLANSGICSRREADEYIQAGVVSVNDQVVTELGVKIVPATDKVLFHDQLVRCERRVYILLNKPKDCVTTVDDPQARTTVLDLVGGACKERIYPVGRLDRNTTGLLLLTNDGDLTTKMTHPKYNQKKIYEAVLDHEMTEEDMQRLRDGIELEDGEIHADAIEYSSDENHCKVGVEIHSGRNRIVRRMFAELGYKVLRLDRVYLAGLTKKNLPRGKWRYLSEMEVNMLKMTK